MTAPVTNAVKKEATETESTPVQAVDANKNVEVKSDEAQVKGQHGEDFCCGSCS